VRCDAGILQSHFVIPPLSTFNARAGAVLDGILARCLERIPDRRFQSATELREALSPLYRKRTVDIYATKKKPVTCIPVKTCAGMSASAPVPLAPLQLAEPEVRLWNPVDRHPPLRLPYAPDWLMTIIAEQEDLAFKAPYVVLIMLIITELARFLDYIMCYLLYFNWHPDNLFWIVCFMITCIVGAIAVLLLILNRRYLKAACLLIVIALECGLYFILHSGAYFCGSQGTLH